MTLFENWILKTVAAIVREMRAENEPDWAETYGTKEDRERYHKSFNEQWDAMEQRAAIVIVQARALEARQLGALVAKDYGSALSPEARRIVSEIVEKNLNRSRTLESMGKEMAEKWPPKPNESDGPKLVTQ